MLNKSSHIDLAQVDDQEIFRTEDGIRPSGDFVISRKRDGSLASHYSDNQWDISAWHPEGRRYVLHFDFWGKETLTFERRALLEDAKWIIFAIIWLRDGVQLSCGTVCNYAYLVRALALHSERLSLGLVDLLNDDRHLLDFSQRCCKNGHQKVLRNVISLLENIGESRLGFTVVGEKCKSILKANAKQFVTKQTAPIPTRIYSILLSTLSDELTEWEQVAPTCLAFLKLCSRDRVYGRNLSRTQKVKSGSGSVWSTVAPQEVQDYLSKKGLANNVVGLAGMVTQVQLLAKLTIQAYSGMRDDEAFSLRYECLIDVVTSGKVHHVIEGRTTKFSKSSSEVRWVTSLEGHRAIKIAQQIANVIYGAYGVEPCASMASREKSFRPLFVSIAYIAGSRRRQWTDKEDFFFAGDLSLARFKKMRARLQPMIEEEDLNELEKIDEHRAWRAEDMFALGSSWTLETHQLRRSLALYAQRSGLVSLPSLRRQLQHITEEMSRYYARGSQYAIDILFDAKASGSHFGNDWQAAQIESESLSYLANVLFTDDRLFGGHAAFVKSRYPINRMVVSDTRAETIRMFKNGQLRYRETLIGGCTSGDVCEKVAVDWLSVECISNNCKNMVGNLNKLEAVVAEQGKLLEALEVGSLLYRTEDANLQVLIKARDRARGERTKGTI